MGLKKGMQVYKWKQECKPLTAFYSAHATSKLARWNILKQVRLSKHYLEMSKVYMTTKGEILSVFKC